MSSSLLKINFREKARSSLTKANNELASQDASRLKYVALELRMAIEAITYDRAQAYKDEIPPDEYKTWQPRKLMQLLLDIDPDTDKNSGIGIGLEKTPGVPAEETTYLGTENVFNFKSIKDHYDALGSFLHMPTLKQFDENKAHDSSKLRARCEKIIEALEAALSSPVFNITIGSFSEIPCMRCDAKVRRRLALSGDDAVAKCFKCGAEYKITGTHSSKPGMWEALYEEIDCPTIDCDSKIRIWKDKVKEGSQLTCEHCEESFYIGYGVFKK